MKKIILILIALFQFVTVVEAYSLEVADKVDIVNTCSAINNGLDYRSQSIVADITGHTLTIEFKEDVAMAHVIVRNNYGAIVAQETVISTPDVITFTINDAGHYRMEIILVNGDQYYGDFQVMN